MSGADRRGLRSIAISSPDVTALHADGSMDVAHVSGPNAGPERTPDEVPIVPVAVPLIAVIAVMLVVASVAAAVMATGRVGTLTGLAVAVSLGVLVVAADIDRRTRRVPDALVGLAAVPVVLAWLGGAAAHGLVAGAALAAVPIAVLHLISPDAMGFGDVKLAVVLGAVIGLVDARLALLALCLASGSATITGLVRRRRTLAFGPFLVAGASAVLVAAAVGQTVLAHRLADAVSRLSEAVPWR